MNLQEKETIYTSGCRYRFRFAGITIDIRSPFPLLIGKGLAKYILAEGDPDAGDSVRICVSRMAETGKEGFVLCGKDMLLEYYQKETGSGTLWCCEAPGKFGPVTRALYTDGFHQVFYEINEKAYPRHITSADKILQLFPMRKLLFEKRVFLLHASQAVLEGKGILFTGDSGVGKTTQARLLEQFYGAEITCNDRTGILKEKGKWKTCGFPIDGSMPVNHVGNWELGAVAVLVQSRKNRIARYSGIEAVKDLMRQLMLDVWNFRMCAETARRVIDLIKEVPVYRLECTADRGAPDCLTEQLRKDGILKCRMRV